MWKLVPQIHQSSHAFSGSRCQNQTIWHLYKQPTYPGYKLFFLSLWHSWAACSFFKSMSRHSSRTARAAPGSGMAATTDSAFEAGLGWTGSGPGRHGAGSQFDDPAGISSRADRCTKGYVIFSCPYMDDISPKTFAWSLFLLVFRVKIHMKIQMCPHRNQSPRSRNSVVSMVSQTAWPATMLKGMNHVNPFQLLISWNLCETKKLTRASSSRHWDSIKGPSAAESSA